MDAGMIQTRTLSKRTLSKSSRFHPSPALWLGGLCWLATIGGLAAPALAQTPSDAVPSAQDLLLLPAEPTLDAAPEAFEAAPPPAPEPMLEPIPDPAPAESSLPSRSVELELSSPVESSGSEDLGSGGASSPPLVNPNLSQQAESAFGQPSSDGFSDGFIDPTPYSLGATDNPSVILSERSTGCEAVVQPGQAVPSGLCSFATQDTAYGGGITPSNFGDMSLSVVYGGRTTPAGRDYYNLTIRPPARLTIANVGLLFPLSIPAAITSAFGWRLHPVVGESRFHSGTDLGAPQGTPVMAAFSGKVAVADFMGGYGLAVVLQHNKGSEETLYAHLSEIFVKPGETVKQGEVIGRVGSTGLSTGPHLHFEFRKQTPNGWVVMDAGGALDYALSQFLNALNLGLPYPPQLAAIRSASFTKALEMAQARPTTRPEEQSGPEEQSSLEAQAATQSPEAQSQPQD
jgi:murein DD-endopeptidase MepM/ murein hydrolase activator NlpD